MDAPYPAAKVLLELIADLGLQDHEVLGILELPNDVDSKHKLQLLRERPGELKISDASIQRIKTIFDIHLTAEHDFADMGKIAAWYNATHELCGGLTPRAVLTRPFAELESFRNQFCPGIPLTPAL